LYRHADGFAGIGPLGDAVLKAGKIPEIPVR
jgi:hypothetical protein